MIGVGIGNVLVVIGCESAIRAEDEETAVTVTVVVVVVVVG